ncbi:unnamed protein product [Protopolystoma xenopodis]|uniref:Uncharacterized protein n=1 Tax=Protopolystoma xenopodis TaxID=117903 RepID=A0A448XAU4_9PLAT|nr:unnamed protein product [Protopolystoma xenopodis]
MTDESLAPFHRNRRRLPRKRLQHESSSKANRQLVKRNPPSSSSGTDLRIYSPNTFTRNGNSCLHPGSREPAFSHYSHFDFAEPNHSADASLHPPSEASIYHSLLGTEQPPDDGSTLTCPTTTGLTMTNCPPSSSSTTSVITTSASASGPAVSGLNSNNQSHLSTNTPFGSSELGNATTGHSYLKGSKIRQLHTHRRTTTLTQSGNGQFEVLEREAVRERVPDKLNRRSNLSRKQATLDEDTDSVCLSEKNEFVREEVRLAGDIKARRTETGVVGGSASLNEVILKGLVTRTIDPEPNRRLGMFEDFPSEEFGLDVLGRFQLVSQQQKRQPSNQNSIRLLGEASRMEPLSIIRKRSSSFSIPEGQSSLNVSDVVGFEAGTTDFTDQAMASAGSAISEIGFENYDSLDYDSEEEMVAEDAKESGVRFRRLQTTNVPGGLKDFKQTLLSNWDSEEEIHNAEAIKTPPPVIDISDLVSRIIKNSPLSELVLISFMHISATLLFFLSKSGWFELIMLLPQLWFMPFYCDAFLLFDKWCGLLHSENSSSTIKCPI